MFLSEYGSIKVYNDYPSDINYNSNANIIITTTSNKLQDFFIQCNRPIYLPPPNVFQVPFTEESTCESDEVAILPIKERFKFKKSNSIIELYENNNTLGFGKYEKQIEVKNKKFLVIKFCLFDKADSKDELFIEEMFNEKEQEKKNFLNKKRARGKVTIEKRKYREYNIRTKIIRYFFNQVLINKINDELKMAGSDISFTLFSREFVNEFQELENKKVLNMTLEDILKDKELYGKNISKNSNYSYNIRRLEKLKSEEYKGIRESIELDRILKMTFYEMFQEYLSSKEFVKHVNLLKSEKKNDNLYIKYFIYYSKKFLEHYTGKKKNKKNQKN